MNIVNLTNQMQRISKSWTANGSTLICIPKELSNKFHFQDANIVITDTPDGLLLRKLEELE